MGHKSKWISAGMLGVLFVGINLYLIKEDLLLVDRTSLVHDQKQAQTEDLQEILVKDGVIHTATEQHVYFSEQLGIFTRFLVEEGQVVTSGTPLYEYDVVDLEEQRLLFDSEAEQIRSEINAVESYISELETLERQLSDATISSSSADANPTSSLDDQELLLNIELEVGIDISDATIDQTRSLLSQQIGEQEAAVGRLQAQEDKFTRLSEGLEESPTVQVESDFNGKIAYLSEGVENPLITIYSDNLTSQILLTDEEALYVLAGMPAKVSSPVAGSTVDGAVVANPQLPEEEPKTDEKSYYSVDVDLQEPGPEWFIGQNVVNEIVTDEALGATTVPTISLDEKRLYTLSPTGLIEPRIVDLGLRVEDRQEVYSNVEPAEWLVIDPLQVERFNSAYITPMNVDRLTTDNLGTLGQRSSWKHVLLGVLPN
ncbi:efflux RND transporter periplasmic adaptor subunit [Jeotgalibacillus proteolyticus]|uniref:efflux RND transporter periplasmic adaptor subunit n=1 Tax=Jeotgalibacillus proteolyticus TaxID=2082395 RepID=UPI003CE68407